jgi:hypothetical protein
VDVFYPGFIIGNTSGKSVGLLTNSSLTEIMSSSSLEKTLNMIFAGAKLQQQQNRHKTNNAFNDSMTDTMEDVSSCKSSSVFPSSICHFQKLPESKGCKLCWKDTDPTSNSTCKNCNLKICETCGTKCASCSITLCTTCVQVL